MVNKTAARKKNLYHFQCWRCIIDYLTYLLQALDLLHVGGDLIVIVTSETSDDQFSNLSQQLLMQLYGTNPPLCRQLSSHNELQLVIHHSIAAHLVCHCIKKKVTIHSVMFCLCRLIYWLRKYVEAIVKTTNSVWDLTHSETLRNKF